MLPGRREMPQMLAGSAILFGLFVVLWRWV
jgi:hypothetical protein